MAKKGIPESIEIFNSINGIGASYASKHSYFWSIHSESPLIVVDSKIVGTLGYNSIQSHKKQSSYSQTVKAFVDKSIEEFGESNPSSIEQALFSFHNFYFLNDNTGWKNQTEFNDYHEAQKLALTLFPDPIEE